MAGFLSMLPGFMSAVNDSGIVSKLADAAGSLASNIAEGKVNSWQDFGKGIVGIGSKLFGPAGQIAEKVIEGFSHKPGIVTPGIEVRPGLSEAERREGALNAYLINRRGDPTQEQFIHLPAERLQERVQLYNPSRQQRLEAEYRAKSNALATPQMSIPIDPNRFLDRERELERKLEKARAKKRELAAKLAKKKEKKKGKAVEEAKKEKKKG